MKALLKHLPLAGLALMPLALQAQEVESAPVMEEEIVGQPMPIEDEGSPATAPEASDPAMAPAASEPMMAAPEASEPMMAAPEASDPAMAAPAATETTTTTVVTEETTITEVTEPVAPPPARVTDYVSVLGHYYWLDDAWMADHGSGLQLLRGWNLKDSWYLEGALFTNVFETDVDGATDFYQYGLGLDLVYALGDRVGFTPFALVGAGAAYNDIIPDSDDEWSATGNAGIGFVTGPVSDFGFRLRAEGRYIYNSFEDGLSDYRVSVGMELPLLPMGGEKMTGLPLDEGGVQVVSTEVGDADGDGVADPYDACPDTPRGMEVDGRGCALPQVLTLTGVVFEFDSARLTSDARKILEDVSKKIIAYKDIPMELAGHTDSVGPDDYNLKLSNLRAGSVRDYLIEQGVAGGKLTASGFGESQPVAANDTAAGRQLNRRVELRIEGQK
jgi:OOP family OmpA-OmpF porin